MARPRKNPKIELSPSVQRLADVITELEISKAKFAGRLGMSASGINTIFLKDGAQISMVLAKAIECEFGVSHRWLLEGEEPRSVSPRDKLPLGDQWMLDLTSAVDGPSQVTMVDIPMNLAALYFIRLSIRYMRLLGDKGFQDHEVITNIVDWQKSIHDRLKKDWDKLRLDLPSHISESRSLYHVDSEEWPRSQLKQWWTARYYFMDVIVWEDKPRPSLDADLLGLDIDIAWIDEHRAVFHQEWEQLRTQIHDILSESPEKLVRFD